MKLTKEDYMRLPKARLAELLVEAQEKEELTLTSPSTTPYLPAEPYRPIDITWQTISAKTNN